MWNVLVYAKRMMEGAVRGKKRTGWALQNIIWEKGRRSGEVGEGLKG